MRISDHRFGTGQSIPLGLRLNPAIRDYIQYYDCSKGLHGSIRLYQDAILLKGRAQGCADFAFMNESPMSLNLARLRLHWTTNQALLNSQKKIGKMVPSPLEAALIETWTLYAIGTVVIMLRVLSRTRLVGISGYHPDDYIIFFSWVRPTGRQQELGDY